jgi:hypothetical protein
MGSYLLHADGQADRHDEATIIIAFRNSAKAPKNHKFLMIPETVPRKQVSAIKVYTAQPSRNWKFYGIRSHITMFTTIRA